MNASTLKVDTFLPYMREVQRCDESLRELNLTWRMLEANARINCAQEAQSILPMMAATRQGFERLEHGLVASLVEERVATVLQTVGIKARHVVDIVVRNLYERTADVGFLATDRDLCEFLAQGDAGDVERARARLVAYRNKYTVYEDIMLLDARGRVRVRIDSTAPEPATPDPLIAQTLAQDGYVETFRASELRPKLPHALLYSRRMRGADGQIVGLLCLSFDFEREMQGIFQSRSDPEERAVMLLIDGEHRVIASADSLWIPPGTVVPVNHDETPRLVVFSGREYLVQTWRPKGYQGYPGPSGWQGQVMAPVDMAFTAPRSQALADQPPERVHGLLTHARDFCPPLWEIVTAAQAINRVVWNGQVMTARQGQGLDKLKALLALINETGGRTNALFSQSIRDLYDTVLGAQMRRGEFVTHLQVELLDRNLYERADDCRWWALTPELRQALAAGADAPSMEVVSKICSEINALYTVYTRLVVYDRSGCIVAATAPQHDDGQSVIGESIEADTLAAVLALASPQHYHVTPFRPSRLYEGRATYIFHAAIRAPDDDQQVIGGIGIVFDAEPEFRAMLRDALDGQGEGCRACFVDRNGIVIASLDDSTAVGSPLAGLPSDLRALPGGEGAARIIEDGGQYTVLAVAASSGYREFKTSDGYREDVLAVVFDPLGEVVTGHGEHGSVELAELAELAGPDVGQGEQFATVVIDGQLHALPASQVLEALPGSSILRVASGRAAHRLGVVQLKHQGAGSRAVWVYDLVGVLRGEATQQAETRQVAVVQVQDLAIGLLVDSLHGVPEFAPAQIKPAPDALERGWIDRIVSVDEGRVLIPVVNVAEVVRRCTGEAPVVAEALVPDWATA